MEQIPWRGVLTATALPFGSPDLSVDLDAYAEHVRWLAENGCRGVVPNGSLGEYQVLSAKERAAVVRTTVEAAPAGFSVIPGVAAYGADEARRWADQAAEAGCHAVMLLPPTAYRADDAAVLAHYREVAKAGLPVVAYNNPLDTRVDLTPTLLRQLFDEGLVVAVKEFSGDVRRAYAIAEVAPGLDLLAGADDVALELLMAGAVGWIGGYQNAIPASCARLYQAAVAGDLATALPLYRTLHPLLRWDSRPEFVQAIKLSMDVAGRPGGPTRQPRQPLPPAVAAEIRETTERLLAAGHH
ncbi:dihydrodipicolinate synthase family protein [Micromonospora peucetia]|uniref:4-hydroxy-tetrahydrodipicolinate synthase n=1 Tax=Micromonospora peucetia TaxID=47871 RepID=A0A1C6W2S1_9ACTN|nr:dihydrodipicolinate synthase family protein [Micromonospora peucetia]MCX4391235.1 dihydrodipicolinate synthase family protein [Micromonospora peucetia]WSA32145.1 dihydrodipicolinate synthase family protein [Micromonospora peucetia]SCL72863.1 4-hydroxy-tetrahydrodipicolinate synthase [Micromonospora peucetia]